MKDWSKTKWFNILEYVLLILIIIISIIYIIRFSYDLGHINEIAHTKQTVIFGITCFSIVLLLSLGGLIYLIKYSIYRSRCTKMKKK